MNSTLPLALTFLTKLPWPWRGPADEAALARSMFWFPWVGALLGAGFWLAWAGLQKMLPAPAAAFSVANARAAEEPYDSSQQRV